MNEQKILQWFIRLFRKGMNEYPEDQTKKEKLYEKIKRMWEK